MKYRFKRLDSVTFLKVDGRDVPCHPWPQEFYVSGFSMETCEVKVRPLTLTGLAKGLSRNFVTMNYWRLMHAMFRMGFIACEPGEMLSWRGWQWHPIQERRRRRSVA